MSTYPWRDWRFSYINFSLASASSIEIYSNMNSFLCVISIVRPWLEYNCSAFSSPRNYSSLFFSVKPSVSDDDVRFFNVLSWYLSSYTNLPISEPEYRISATSLAFISACTYAFINSTCCCISCHLTLYIDLIIWNNSTLSLDYFSSFRKASSFTALKILAAIVDFSRSCCYCLVLILA